MTKIAKLYIIGTILWMIFMCIVWTGIKLSKILTLEWWEVFVLIIAFTGLFIIDCVIKALWLK